jgi:uncharacterized protein (DUF488 family)
MASAPVIYTIGHSTRPASELVELLSRYGVELLADTRRFPRSLGNPQFNRDQLEPLLAERGIGYQHFAILGGRRKPAPDSANTAWENAAFRGYADYMATEPFQASVSQLEASARKQTVAVMCAELAWWRCHRRLIADKLSADGFEVLHILTPTSDPYAHKLGPGFVNTHGHITYRGQGSVGPSA